MRCADSRVGHGVLKVDVLVVVARDMDLIAPRKLGGIQQVIGLLECSFKLLGIFDGGNTKAHGQGGVFGQHGMIGAQLKPYALGDLLGAWLAARSGRLDGRRVALPWYYIGGFGRDFPGISIATAQDFHEDGPWLSAALSTGMVDMAATLAQQAMGPELALALRAVLRPDPERGQAALEALQARHIPSTRDSTLARAIAWMEQHLDCPYELDAVAAAASVSPRTLLRHFREELGHSPLDHLHGLRCARARVLLEITLESIPTIAQACGYADPAAPENALLTGRVPVSEFVSFHP